MQCPHCGGSRKITKGIGPSVLGGSISSRRLSESLKCVCDGTEASPATRRVENTGHRPVTGTWFPPAPVPAIAPQTPSPEDES